MSCAVQSCTEKSNNNPEGIVLNKNLLVCYPEPRSRSQQCLVAVSFTINSALFRFFFASLWKYPLPVPLAEPVRGSCESQESDHGYDHRQKNLVLISVKFPEESGNLQRYERTKLVWLLSLVLPALPCRTAPVVEGSFPWNCEVVVLLPLWDISFLSQTGSSVFSQSARRKV